MKKTLFPLTALSLALVLSACSSSSKKDEAMAAVPDELVDAVHLVGPAERIRERLQAWKAAGSVGHVGSMLIGAGQPEALELIADEML